MQHIYRLHMYHPISTSHIPPKPMPHLCHLRIYHAHMYQSYTTHTYAKSIPPTHIPPTNAPITYRPHSRHIYAKDIPHLNFHIQLHDNYILSHVIRKVFPRKTMFYSSRLSFVLKGFMFYLCYLYLLTYTGVQHDFHIR